MASLVIAVVVGVMATGALGLLGPLREKKDLRSEGPFDPAVIVRAYDPDLRFEGSVPDADKRYRGNTLLVKGKVDAAGKDAAGAPWLCFDAGHRSMRVRCYFPSEQEGGVLRLRKGDIALVEGVCAGLRGGDVFFRDCSLH